jgi:putative phage-type endonuclease
MPAQKADYKPTVAIDTANLSREEWLSCRRSGVGGSDVAAIMGVSPFATARDVYYDKLNIASTEDGETNWVAKEIGNRLESLVAEIFQKKTGHRIFQMKKMFRHPLYPFMIADIDYYIGFPGGGFAILEIKTTHYNNRDSWRDGNHEIIPLNYELQGRHYMSVLNLDRVYFCCLYGSGEDDVIIRRLDRDLDYEAELIALEENFWVNHVKAKVPPPYTENGDMVIESVRRHCGGANPNAPEITLTDSAGIARFLELQAIKGELDTRVKTVERQMQEIKGRVADAMGSSCFASCAVGGVPYLVSYNPVYRTGIDKTRLSRFREQHPDLYEQYVTVTESRRFCVRPKEQEAA